jgi:hypothetical protein
VSPIGQVLLVGGGPTGIGRRRRCRHDSRSRSRRRNGRRRCFCTWRCARLVACLPRCLCPFRGNVVAGWCSSAS